jgi:hypothetical protein
MRVSDNRYEEDLREHNLAMQMIAQGARTRTIMRWTGLSRHRVQMLARRYETSRPGDHRRRGISPHQSTYFSQSETLQAESLALAFIASEMQVIPSRPLAGAPCSLPDVARGERLILAYQWYRALVPEPQISLERAILFITELVDGRNLSLRRCRQCSDPMVVDHRQPATDPGCPFCNADRRAHASVLDDPIAGKAPDVSAG